MIAVTALTSARDAHAQATAGGMSACYKAVQSRCVQAAAASAVDGPLPGGELVGAAIMLMCVRDLYQIWCSLEEPDWDSAMSPEEGTLTAITPIPFKNPKSYDECRRNVETCYKDGFKNLENCLERAKTPEARQECNNTEKNYRITCGDEYIKCIGKNPPTEPPGGWSSLLIPRVTPLVRDEREQND
jgi:hypothetical protein